MLNVKKIGLFLILLLPVQLTAAEVVKKVKKKKYIIINEGSRDGISKGDKFALQIIR